MNRFRGAGSFVHQVLSFGRRRHYAGQIPRPTPPPPDFSKHSSQRMTYAPPCNHPRTPVPAFDEVAARGLSAEEVRRRWPRGEGPCPDCGVPMITYASGAHFAYGDW